MIDLGGIRGHLEMLMWARERMAELKQVEANARDAIQEALGDQEIGQIDGKTVVTWTTHKKRQLQQRALKEAHPELVEEFTEIVEARTFKVVDDA